jgi:hypothetical protein
MGSIILAVMLSTSEIVAIPPDKPVIEARRRGGKGNKKRRRGGNGLR